jgi:ribosomal protein S18 acetylase RimI-like enzyme
VTGAVTLRRAVEADLDLIERAERAERAYMVDVEPASLAAWTAALDRNRALWRACLERTTVLELDGRPAGFVMWTPDRSAALLVTVQVLPPARRRGLGRRLLRAVARDVAAAGRPELRLGVHRDNPARGIYPAAGFEPAGEDGDYLLYRGAPAVISRVPGMVSVDPPTPAPATAPLDPASVGRGYRAVELLHGHVYFAPEPDEQFVAAGLRPGRMCYFAGRAAAMGAVGAGVVTATFYNFSPAVVARFFPRAWTLAAPDEVVAARLRGARAALERLLGGPEAAAAPEVAELAGLLREACTALTPEGRALYAGHADQPWPDEPVQALWHGATLLREYRGDGHIAVLQRYGLSGLEALISNVLLGRGLPAAVMQANRGWTDEEWAAGTARLADRGLVADGSLTDAGRGLRADLEAATDELSTAPWLHLGPERTARVIELGKRLSRTLVANGAYPEGLTGG